MPELFPRGYQSEAIPAEEAQPGLTESGYAPGLFFEGDLRRDGKFRLVESTGVECWEQWCRKCLLTPRYGSPCYSAGYGIDWEEVLSADSREVAKSILTREISEALLADPRGRTRYVRSVDVDWLPEGGVDVHVSAVGIENATADFTIRGGEGNGLSRAGLSG